MESHSVTHSDPHLTTLPNARRRTRLHGRLDAWLIAVIPYGDIGLESAQSLAVLPGC